MQLEDGTLCLRTCSSSCTWCMRVHHKRNGNGSVRQPRFSPQCFPKGRPHARPWSRRPVPEPVKFVVRSPHSYSSSFLTTSISSPRAGLCRDRLVRYRNWGPGDQIPASGQCPPGVKDDPRQATMKARVEGLGECGQVSSAAWSGAGFYSRRRRTPRPGGPACKDAKGP